MLRPASPHALIRLQAASYGSDRDLDGALSDVGVLPPLDLHAIRDVLNRPDVDLTTRCNAEGHTIIEIHWNSQLAALMHNDGRVQVLSTAAA